MSLLFNESLKKIEFIFKINGMYLDRPIQNTAEHLIKFRLWFIINFLWLNTDVLGEFLWIIQGAMLGKSLAELTYIVPCTTFCMLANIKTLSLVLNGDKIKRLFEKLRDLENIGAIEEYWIGSEKETIVGKSKKNLNDLIKIVNVSYTLTIIMFSLSPAILMGLEYKKSGQIKLMLQFLVVYPFDPYDIKYWPFAYLHLVWSTVLVVSQVAVADCLFYACCTSICTQFRLLQHDFQAMIPERMSDEDVFLEKFKKSVVRHEEIIQSVILLEGIYTKSTLFNFVSSSFLICLTGFNVTVIDDVPFLLTFLSFLVMSLLQIYLLCFFGDMIMTASMEVSSAVYNSKWYIVNAKRAKDLFVVQIRAQKPCKLTAFSYVDVNLKAFTKVLSTAWSYFALLKSMDSPSKA